MLNRRHVIAAALAAPFVRRARAQAQEDDPAAALVAAATAQIGVTVSYDGAYETLAYPMGDVPRERGVCTDVVIRAYRDALGRDLQQLVHEDMRRDFGAYPKLWGLKRPDRNIDHRRVPNLRTFLTRAGAALADDAELQPGDLVTMTVPPNLPHIAIVSHLTSGDGTRFLIVHNIGAGTRLEDRLTAFPQTGRYRWT